MADAVGYAPLVRRRRVDTTFLRQSIPVACEMMIAADGTAALLSSFIIRPSFPSGWLCSSDISAFA